MPDMCAKFGTCGFCLGRENDFWIFSPSSPYVALLETLKLAGSRFLDVFFDYFDFVENIAKRSPNENFTACTGSHALVVCQVSSQLIALSRSNWVGRGRGFNFFLAVLMMLEGCKFVGAYLLSCLTCVPSLSLVAFRLPEKKIFKFFLKNIGF